MILSSLAHSVIPLIPSELLATIMISPALPEVCLLLPLLFLPQKELLVGDCGGSVALVPPSAEAEGSYSVSMAYPRLTGRMGRARLPAPGAALRAPARGHGGARLPRLGDALGVGAMAEQEAAPDAPPAPDTGAGRQGGEPPGAVDR